MAKPNEYCVFRYIELNDAKSIVKYSSIVHDSITYLDLNIGEYSTYKREIATLKLDSPNNFEARFESKESTRNLAAYSKPVGPSLHLEVPSESIYRVVLQADMCSYCLERDDKSFYIDNFYVEEIWYERVFQLFMILCIKQTKRKLASLRKFFRFRDERFSYESAKLSICYCMKILCIECYKSDSVKGIFIAINISAYDDEPEEVHEYFIYHHCTSSGNRLPETIDFDEDIIGLLIRLGFYRFIPHLLKYGFSPLSEENDHEIYDNKIMISRRRYRLMHDIRRLHKLYQTRSQDPENCDLQLLSIAGEALTLMWRTTPDVLLSQNEIVSVFTHYPANLTAEEFQSLYERIVGVIPLEPTPRSLSHYCRLVVRKAMSFNLQLPHGISKLDSPSILKEFLSLEY